MTDDSIVATATPTIMGIMTLSYFYMIHYFSTIMAKRQAFSLNTAMQAYNIFQIFFNAYIVYGLHQAFPPSNIFGINIAYDDKIRYFVFLHYISKYIDYLDTFFMLVRKKTNQLSFLHIYHHSTVGLVWGSLLYIGHGNGTAAFGCMVNSFIHTIMYSHYFYTSLGFKNPFKQYITMAQMLQFNLGIVHAILVLLYEHVATPQLAYIELSYQIIMLYLFGKFYLSSY